MKRVFIPTTALLAVVCAAALLSGGDWLGRPVVGVPVGNAVAWGALISLALLAWLASGGSHRPWLRWPSGTLIAAAIVWLPVSIAMFGNVYLSNGSNLVLLIWVPYTVTLLIAPLLVLGLSGIAGLARFFRSDPGPVNPDPDSSPAAL